MRHNVLLIENDEPLYTAVVRYLERRGHRVTACRSEAEAERTLERVPDRTHAPELFVADASCMGFYLKARARFPGLRWLLSDTDASDVVAPPGRDQVPYDATIDQPEATFPSDELH